MAIKLPVRMCIKSFNTDNDVCTHWATVCILKNILKCTLEFYLVINEKLVEA